MHSASGAVDTLKPLKLVKHPVVNLTAGTQPGREHPRAVPGIVAMTGMTSISTCIQAARQTDHDKNNLLPEASDLQHMLYQNTHPASCPP